MAEGADPHRLVRPPLWQDGIEGLTALKSQLLLLQQQIDGENEGDEPGADSTEHPHGGGDGAGHHAANAGSQEVPQILRQLCPVDRQIFQPAGDLRVGGKLLLRPDHEPSRRRGHVAAQAGDALSQLGHHHQHQQKDDQRQQEERQQQAHRPGQGGRYALLLPFLLSRTGEKPALQSAHRHVQHKGQRRAYEQGSEDSPQKSQGIQHYIQPLNAHQQQYCKCDQKHDPLHRCFGKLHIHPPRRPRRRRLP